MDRMHMPVEERGMEETVPEVLPCVDKKAEQASFQLGNQSVPKELTRRRASVLRECPTNKPSGP